MLTWREQTDAAAFARSQRFEHDVRLRCVRLVRDYGMFDRREAPQYYPDARRERGF
jgi:hypothetical protein